MIHELILFFLILTFASMILNLLMLRKYLKVRKEHLALLSSHVAFKQVLNETAETRRNVEQAWTTS